MSALIFGFTAALVSALLLTRQVRSWGLRSGWVDYPDGERRGHASPVPRIGGVAVYASVLLVLAVALLVGAGGLGDVQTRQLVALIGGGAAVFAIGFWDDTRGLSARTKFGLEVVVSLLVFAAGIRITGFGLPDGGSVWFPPWLSLPLTVVWIVGVTNAFNLIDGSDGVAAGAALFASATLALVSLLAQNELGALVALTLAGATLGFLFFNFPPASVFLGDSGSLFLGFTLAGLGLVTTQTAPTALAVTIPVIAFGLPILDTMLAMVRRFLRGEAIFNPDRGHIHHRLLDLGHSPRRVAFILYAASAGFAMLALLLAHPTEPAAAIVFTVSGAAVLIAVQRLHIPELLELGRILNRGRYHRLTIAHNIRIREAVRRLQCARTGGEVLDAATHAFENGEFVRAEIWLETAAARPLQGCCGVSIEPHGMLWSWCCAGASSADAWEMRLPFVDVSGRAVGRLSLWRPIHDGYLLADVRLLAAEFQTELQRTLVRLDSGRVTTHAMPKRAADSRVVGI